MKANPGGIITGGAILGRESEISEIWHHLELTSVVLTAERRVGKTSVLRKMAENPRNNWMPLLVFVESVRHPVEWVEKLYVEADQVGARSGKAGRPRGRCLA